MADLAILGHLQSSPEQYIGAIAIGGLIFNFIYAIFSFLRMGTTGFTAQAYGAGNKKECSQIFARSMMVAIAGGFILIMIQVPIDWFTFRILDSSSTVKELAYLFTGKYILYILTDNLAVISQAAPYLFWLALIIFLLARSLIMTIYAPKAIFADTGS